MPRCRITGRWIGVLPEPKKSRAPKPKPKPEPEPDIARVIELLESIDRRLRLQATKGYLVPEDMTWP